MSFPTVLLRGDRSSLQVHEVAQATDADSDARSVSGVRLGQCLRPAREREGEGSERHADHREAPRYPVPPPTGANRKFG